MERDTSGNLRNVIVSGLIIFLPNALAIAAAIWIGATGRSLLLILPLALLVTAIDGFVLRTWLHAAKPAANGASSRRLVDDLLRPSGRRNPTRDDATGLYVRWYFEQRLAEEAARCKRYNHPMAVVIMRIGRPNLASFSTDEWQERSLKAARRTASVIRNVDLSTLLAPFEYALCLIHCNREGAISAVERLVSQLDEGDCEAGIAVFPDEGYDWEALMEVARVRMRPFAPANAA